MVKEKILNRAGKKWGGGGKETKSSICYICFTIWSYV